jgi:hypothetical protein
VGNGVNSITDAEVASGGLPKSRPSRPRWEYRTVLCLRHRLRPSPQEQHGGHDADRSGPKEKRYASDYHWNGQQEIGSRTVGFCQRSTLYRMDRRFCLKLLRNFRRPLSGFCSIPITSPRSNVPPTLACPQDWKNRVSSERYRIRKSNCE